MCIRDSFIGFVTSEPEAESAEVEQQQPAINRLANAKGDELEQVVFAMVDELADPRQANRKRILAELSKRGADVTPILVKRLNHRRLALRAAAAGALQFVTGKNVAFDAFAAEEQRQQQAKAWAAATAKGSQ